MSTINVSYIPVDGRSNSLNVSCALLYQVCIGSMYLCSFDAFGRDAAARSPLHAVLSRPRPFSKHVGYVPHTRCYWSGRTRLLLVV
jgi:hypothetical protein